MSYDEYIDLYLLAQENSNALYHVISFDFVNSKSIPAKERRLLQEKIITITQYVYNKLLEKEKESNKQILVKDKRFYRPWDYSVTHTNGNFLDPVIFGDCFQFTILKDTVSKDYIIELVNKIKNDLNIQEELHIADGYYETNEYEEGSNKLYRGYCLQILQNMHKPLVKEKILSKKNRPK